MQTGMTHSDWGPVLCMKTSTIPTLLGAGMTSLREYAGYHGGGSGFGGSCGRGTHRVKVWMPLLPTYRNAGARASGSYRRVFFRLSHRQSWRYLGIGEEEARAFSREVEAAWKEFAEDDCCCIDVERKRTFTMMIREGVAMHAFNGELFVQATGYQFVAAFRTQFRMVSPKRISNPNNTGDSRNCRAGDAD
ncbi:hypothetical protein ECZU29_00200 [Escherichia coli]|nr:hypothetical protein ECZU29_00200 [Escherichia coli]